MAGRSPRCHHDQRTALSGVGRSTVDRLVRADVLRIARKGVYVLTATRSTLEQRCAVLSAVHPTGYVTGPTAGALYGLRRMPPASALHFGCRHGVHLPAEPGVRFRQTRALTASDRWIRPDGIIVAKPRTACLRPGDRPVAARSRLGASATARSTVGHLRASSSRSAVDSAIQRDLGALGSRRACIGSIGVAPAQSHPEVILAEALWQRSVPVERQSR